MKTFVGTKVVRAASMPLGEYNEFRGWKMPEGEDPKAEGYLVEYIGTTPNVDGFAGYISWAPRAAFDDSHIQLRDGESPNALMRFFAYAHLPSHLQATDRLIGLLAQQMDSTLPDGPEKTTGLRKLLEAKDCFVRAALDKPKA